MKIAIVIPTYNEAENVEELFARLAGVTLPDAAVIVVDDASPDGTADLAEKTALPHELIILRREGERGLGRALRHGMRHALGLGAEIIVTMDADLSHDPSVLPSLVAEAEGGAGLVLGSRRVAGGSVSGWNRWRDRLSRAAVAVAHRLLGVRAKDATTGLRAYRADFLRSVDLDEVRSRGYAFQEEMVMRAESGGERVSEIPISFVDRRRGASKLSLAEAFGSFGSLLAVRLRSFDWAGALAITAILLAGFVLRIALAPAKGSAYDLWAFSDWAMSADRWNWLGFYVLRPSPIITFPNYALYFPILALLGPSADYLTVAGRELLKLPSILMDLFLAAAIYRASPRGWKLFAAGFFVFSPAVWYDSAVWGQTDSLHSAFLFLSVVAAGNEKMRKAWILFAVAVFFKLQAVAILPLLAYLTLRGGGWRKWLGDLTPALALAFAVIAPYAFRSGGIVPLAKSLYGTVGTFPLVSYNAWNPWHLYQMFSGGRVIDFWNKPYFWIGAIVYAMAVVGILRAYPKLNGRASAVYAAALLCLAIFLFPTEMHERYLYQVIPLLALTLADGIIAAAWAFAISLIVFFNMNYVELWASALGPISSDRASIMWTVLLVAGFFALFARYLRIGEKTTK